MCRVFPRRFVLPLNVDRDTVYDQDLNARHSSTATAIRTTQNKVSSPTAPPGPFPWINPSSNLYSAPRRSAALTKTSTGTTFTNTAVWSSLRSTTRSTTRAPTATFTAAGSGTWWETR